MDNNDHLNDNKFLEFKKLVYETKLKQAQEKISEKQIKPIVIKKFNNNK
jgi:hypothetical protein